MNLLETTLAKTLGWTILHTLWQGTLIVVLLGVTLYFLRKNTSKMRYWVAWCALLMLFMSAIITGMKVYQEVIPTNEVAPIDAESYMMITLQSASLAEATLTWWDHMEIHFEQHLPLIVLLWTMGVLAFLLRFLGGFIYTQRMKSYGAYPVEEVWEATFQALLARMGVHKSVRLLESTLAKSPMTIGHLKPVILMPLGSLAGLSAQQVEAILIHELAHIKRYDYVLNLIQSLIETLFFYHPAVWLMAAVNHTAG
ncbi:MAG: M56 family metallopeptidase [Bacteroidota bacterium]